MASSVKLEGLEQFKQYLRQLPEELAQEASEIVKATADMAKADVERAYPQGPTGNLRRGVTRQQEHSRFGVSVRLRSRAPHSHLYEKGTASARRTRKGAGRGRMPQAPEQNRMIPIVIRHRARMVDKLKDVVRKAGFQVD